MTACEYTHIGTGISCDGDAGFVLFAHKRRKPICDAVAKRLWTKMRERCIECRQPKWKHWNIVSIHEVEATA